MTPLHNQSPEQIADRLGDLDLIIKGAKEETDRLKAEIKRRGVNVARGSSFILTVTSSMSRRLDTKRLQSDLGEDTLADYYNVTSTSTVRIKPAPADIDELLVSQ